MYVGIHVGQQPDKIDDHVADVRSMYLKALDEDPESKKRPVSKTVLKDVSASGARE